MKIDYNRFKVSIYCYRKRRFPKNAVILRKQKKKSKLRDLRWFFSFFIWCTSSYCVINTNKIKTKKNPPIQWPAARTKLHSFFFLCIANNSESVRRANLMIIISSPYWSTVWKTFRAPFDNVRSIHNLQ